MASCEQSLMMKPLADLRGDLRDAPFPLESKFFQFQAVFEKKIGEIVCWYPPSHPGRLALHLGEMLDPALETNVLHCWFSNRDVYLPAWFDKPCTERH